MERAPRRLTLRRPRRSVKSDGSARRASGQRTGRCPKALRPPWNVASTRHRCGRHRACGAAVTASGGSESSMFSLAFLGKIPW